MVVAAASCDPALGVPLRPYQRRIAEQAIAARSAVVFLPTGTGKTNIAAAYLRHFFSNASIDPTRRQAIFVVPTIPLIKQQTAALQQYLPPGVEVVPVQGGKKVTLATPSRPALYIGVPEAVRQILNDRMRSDGRLMDNIAALVLDEVHHAHDAHPYREILDTVATALGGRPRRDVVATLGLTASLCHARQEDEIRTRIATLLVKIGAGPSDVYSATSAEIDHDGCVLPAPPTELDIDISQLDLISGDSHAPLQSLARAAKREEGNVLPFTIALCRGVLDFEIKLKSLPGFPTPITDTWYATRDVAASQIVKALKPFLAHREVPGLCRLMDALKLTAVSNQLGADTAWYYLSQFPQVRADIDASCAADPDLAAAIEMVFAAGDISFEMKRLAGRPGVCEGVPPAPHRYATLATCVWDHCLAPTTAAQGGTSRRAIVFVRERLSAIIIANFLNRTFTPPGQPEVARAFVSAGGDAPSLLISKTSPTAAAETLRQFREGDVRILVATTVAEEGLDVLRCAAVIHFEKPSNPVAFAQRSGRARATDSVAIVLDGTVRTHQLALEFQRRVVQDTRALAAAMATIMPSA